MSSLLISLLILYAKKSSRNLRVRVRSEFRYKILMYCWVIVECGCGLEVGVCGREPCRGIAVRNDRNRADHAQQGQRADGDENAAGPAAPAPGRRAAHACTAGVFFDRSPMGI